ncbi:hypothetical protein [Candidatus Hodgkinia cicadicola]|uniref:hypothetical protein n=1 Tax=Candidatus Hodgkinia cicadicola TaxID=573658 RepID=UPI001788B519
MSGFLWPNVDGSKQRVHWLMVLLKQMVDVINISDLNGLSSKIRVNRNNRGVSNDWVLY